MKFIRRDFKRYSKLGKNRKKLQKWRRPTGRDNKIRENRKGYPSKVKVGFKSDKSESGKIEGKIPMRVLNLLDLEKIGKNNSVIIGSIGARKKMEVIKKAQEMKLEILNLVGGKKDATK